ncbi:MAG: hypothetical protein WAN12_13950 [Candidatus Acidiferrum sp.]
MKRLPIVAGIALIAIGLALGATAWPQKPSPGIGDRERERRSFAINLVRAIQKAQLDFKSKHAIYANWDSLIGNGYFTSIGTKWASSDFPTVAQALYGSGPEIVPGWRLRLNVSHSGSAYDLLLEDVTDPKCGYAALSDERGTIRQAKSLECPIQ